MTTFISHLGFKQHPIARLNNFTHPVAPNQIQQRPYMLFADRIAVDSFFETPFSYSIFFSEPEPKKEGPTSDMSLREVLSGSSFNAVDEDMSVSDAYGKMKRNNVSMMVVKNHSGSITGVFSEREFNQVFSQNLNPSSTPVKTVMCRDPCTAKVSERVLSCMKTMVDRKLRHLLVVEEDVQEIGGTNSLGKAIGLVSVGDLVNSVIKQGDGTFESLRGFM